MTSAIALPAAHAAPFDITHHQPAAVAGVAVGTGVGVGISNGWFQAASLAGLQGTATGAAMVGAATLGGVAGIGTVAMIDAVTQPCAGFHALLGMNKGSCRNGHPVYR